jgi:sterol desaturase/sphingolipid hydroxylase (fatty acid hydroxylase superfamily)
LFASAAIEFLFGNVIPFAIVSTHIGSHCATIWAWVVVRILETIDGHCGYDFPWSPFRFLPFTGSSRHHDFHHSHNMGNYGSFFVVWDHLFGTDMEYMKYLNKTETKSAS